MGERKNLKDGNKPLLAVYLSAHGFSLAWAILGWPSSIGHLKAIASEEWGRAAVPVLISLVVTFMNRMGKDRVKQALVFWRIEDALPGCRAFSEHALKDPRIDLIALKRAVGGEFPTHPGEQNKAWYRLYQQVQDSPSIEDAHKEYLLFRDIVWLTIPTTLMCQLFLIYVHLYKIGIYYILVSATVYFLARMAAIFASNSLVRSVMAAASSKTEPAKSSIFTL